MNCGCICEWNPARRSKTMSFRPARPARNCGTGFPEPIRGCSHSSKHAGGKSCFRYGVAVAQFDAGAKPARIDLAQDADAPRGPLLPARGNALNPISRSCCFAASPSSALTHLPVQNSLCSSQPETAWPRARHRRDLLRNSAARNQLFFLCDWGWAICSLNRAAHLVGRRSAAHSRWRRNWYRIFRLSDMCS